MRWNIDIAAYNYGGKDGAPKFMVDTLLNTKTGILGS